MMMDNEEITYYKPCAHCGAETLVAQKPHCDACYACICDVCWDKQEVEEEHFLGKCVDANMPWD